jgi:outer membrane scaffolding protein for murein synthesis (MipA/OmpV family)
MKGYKFSMLPKNNFLIATLCLALVSIKSYSAEPVPERVNKLTIGAGFTHHSVPYTAADSRTDPVPLFEMQFGPLFAYNKNDEPVIGVELFRHKRVMLALAGIYGSHQLDIDDVSDDKKWIYYGIEDRDKSTEVALIFHFYSKVGLVDITVARDVSNKHDDFRSSISWSRPFPETGKWTITPRMYGRYYSEGFNAYYYGISEKEMAEAEAIYNTPEAPALTGVSFADYKTNYRPSYESGNGGQFGIDLSIEYNFTDNFKALGYIGMEQLGGRVTSSLLVEDADIWKTSLGLAYTF